MNSNDDQGQKTPLDISIIKKVNTSPQNRYQYLFKVSLIGNSGVGKSSILIRFTEDTFKEDTNSTIGVDFKIVSLKIGDNIAKMQIWDTCGSERFKSLTASYLKSCNVFILVFDITNKKSFDDLETWIQLVKENTTPKFACLVGNKSDIQEQRQVSKQHAIDFAEKYNLKYVEISAKDNSNIEDMFLYVSQILFNDAQKKSKFSSSTESIDDKAFTIGCDKVDKEEIEKSRCKC
jgi:Ras-related protein Rab-1A